MTKRVVLYKKLPEPALAKLASAFELVRFDGVTDREEFLRAVRQAHGLIGASVKVSDEMLEGADQLEAISTISVGYDNFDVPGLTRRGILLTNTPDVLTETVADTIMTLVLVASRRIIELAEYVRAGKWTRSIGEEMYGTDVHGKTIGIIGMGRIGGALAKRAHLGFDMKVVYNSRQVSPDAARYEATFCSLKELLAQADVVCVVVPLTAETEHLLGAEQFALMKPGAIFVNGSRGRVVDEGALIAALRSGHLGAAGLDVFEKEPLPSDSPLRQLPNVAALPHIGSATHEARLAMAQRAVDNLIEVLSGAPCRFVVNPEAARARCG